MILKCVPRVRRVIFKDKGRNGRLRGLRRASFCRDLLTYSRFSVDLLQMAIIQGLAFGCERGNASCEGWYYVMIQTRFTVRPGLAFGEQEK
jgi:hypothetical protein